MVDGGDPGRGAFARIQHIVRVFNSIGWGLAVVLLPAVGLAVMVNALGQGSDAARATLESWRWLFFFSVGLAGYAIASWGIISSVLISLRIDRKAELAIVLSVLGPLLLVFGSL